MSAIVTISDTSNRSGFGVWSKRRMPDGRVLAGFFNRHPVSGVVSVAETPERAKELEDKCRAMGRREGFELLAEDYVFLPMGSVQEEPAEVSE